MSATATLWWAPHALPVSAPAARDVLVTVQEDRITNLEAHVSRDDALARGAQPFDDCVIAPGFVNAHAHLEYAAYGALVDGVSYDAWITDHVHRKRRLSPAHTRASAQLGALESLQAGFTCVGDASYSGDAAYAMHEAGLRGRVYLEVFGGATEADAHHRLDDCMTRRDELPTSELLTLGISPHAPTTVHEPLFRAVASTGERWMTHLLESDEELQLIAGDPTAFADMRAAGLRLPTWSGRSPIEVLADILDERCVAVHVVRASPTDLEILAQHGVGVAHCARSNAWLGCGRFDWQAADRAGVLVGLGTDSPASAGPFDPFATMRATLEVHRAATADHAWPSLANILTAATKDAALVLGYDDVGALDIGARADIVAVQVGAVHDALAAYVLQATPQDVRAVMIAGKDANVRDRKRLEAARARVDDVRRLLTLPVPAVGAR